MVQTDEPQTLPDSIADVPARLALWGRRATKGLARVEFVSDFSRQKVISQLRAALPQNVPLHEIELPFQQSAAEVVHFLRERLGELSPGVVSVTGFATAFSDDCSLEDSLRVLNFHRENIAQFPLCQIWWMTHPFAEVFLRSVPDLDSWFMLRLNLSEEMIDRSLEPPLLQRPQSKQPNPDEARKQSAAYINRFQKALANNRSTSEIIHLAFVATSLLGNAFLEQEEREAAEILLNDMAPQLRKQGFLEDERMGFNPKRVAPLVFGIDYLGHSDELRMLGQLCECADRLAEAEVFYEAALNAVENTSWQDFSASELQYQTLTQFYLRQNRYFEAEQLCKRWVNRQKAITGQNSYGVLSALDQLLEVYLLWNKYAEAEQVYYIMLNMTRKVEFQDHVLEISLLNNLSWLYKRLGRDREAEALSEQASKLPNTT